jgi:hypothetical protein
MEIVRLYCIIPYARKDEAKKRGAKWDINKKQWYFQYNLKDFFENKDLHTYDYEPIVPTIINYDSKQHNNDKIRKVVNNVFNVLQIRWLKFPFK